jgi:acyl-CoA thioester hydrolase
VIDAQFRWPVRVYYEDTDAAGIVYYASYLKFMERARTEWLRSLGVDHGVLLKEHGILFVVARLNIRYREPARLDETLQVDASVYKVGRASFDMNQSVFRDQKTPLCSATVRLACVSGDRMQAVAIPSFLLAELKREN